MFVKDEKTLKWIYYICAGQFALFFIYVQFFAKPVTKAHIGLLALSAVFGIMFAGQERREYQKYKKQQKKQADLDDLDRTLKEIKDNTQK